MISFALLLLAAVCPLTQSARFPANTSNGTNQTLCNMQNSHGYSFNFTTVKCGCDEIAKYDCCWDLSSALFCSHEMTPFEKAAYHGWCYFTLAFNLIGFFVALYSLYCDLQDQKKKLKRGKFKYNFGLKPQALVLIVIFFLLTVFWSLDPHDGSPPFGVELYNGVITTFLLRMPQWLLGGMLMLFILVWRELVEAAQKLRKKSKQQRQEEDARRRRSVYILVSVLLVVGMALSLLRGILPVWVTDYATNLLVVMIVLFLGILGAPYYAFKVNRIRSKATSKNVKAVLGKIVVLSIVFATLSFIGVANYVITIFNNTFSGKLQNYIGTHTAQSLCCLLVAIAMQPQNSSKTKSMRRQNSASSSVQSTKAEDDDVGIEVKSAEKRGSK